MGPPVAILGILLLLCSASAQKTPTCLKRDRDALLAFKAGLFDPGNQLASWTSGGNCCTFVGITCNAQGEVANFTLEAFAETDCEDSCNRIASKFRDTNSVNLIGTTLNKLLSLEVLNLTNFFLQDVTPSGLSALKKLRVLWLSRTLLHGPISEDIGKITSLEYFTLNNNNYEVTGPLPTSFCNLVNLRGLNLTERTKGLKSGALPSCIGQWKQLQYLEADFNSFSGRIPASLKQLKNLKSLKLARNDLSGSLPVFNPGELPTLEELHLQGNAFVGSIPPSFGNLLALKDLRIGGIVESVFAVLIKSKLAGSLPSTLGNLVKLETLFIRATSITGAIPQSLGNLPVISDLRLDINEFTGPIPTNLGKTGSLINLEINDNKLSGPIPSALGGAGKKLSNFVARRNELSGTIPDSLGLLKLSNLDLSFNKLTKIPANLGFGISAGFPVLDLSHNQLAGALNPPSLWGISEVYLQHNLLTSLGSANVPAVGVLRKFFVTSNELAGPIPSWVFELPSMDTLDLSDNKLTKLPALQGSVRSIFYINVSSNAIAGTIPTAFAQECCISVLDLSRNLFTGSIPSALIAPSLTVVLHLGENQLTGPVPSNLYGSFKQSLILNKNRLSGSIPERPTDAATIRYLDLSDNQLTGPIPASLFLPSNFAAVLKLSNNRLSGPVPDFSGLCDGLTGLFLDNNLLTGPILPPGVIFTETCGLNFIAFDVSGNKLSGGIPASIATLKSLRVLDVSKNAITGPIPASLKALEALQVLDVSNNKLTGALPLQQLVSGFTALKVAGQASDYSPGASLFTYLPVYPEDSIPFVDLNLVLTTTTALSVSGNGLTGAIHPSVGDLKGLNLLDLSHNKFTGAVPASIAQITDLDDLNLSFNQLSGPIPTQLKGFPAEDFAGNPGLCGPPLAKKC